MAERDCFAAFAMTAHILAIMPDPMDNRVFVLVLKHPQERREALATAPLIAAALRRTKLAIGLSWPSLARALGAAGEPRRWGGLHLGAGRPASGAARELALPA